LPLHIGPSYKGTHAVGRYNDLIDITAALRVVHGAFQQVC